MTQMPDLFRRQLSASGIRDLIAGIQGQGHRAPFEGFGAECQLKVSGPDVSSSGWVMRVAVARVPFHLPER